MQSFVTNCALGFLSTDIHKDTLVHVFRVPLEGPLLGKSQYPSLGGLEPPSSRLTAERASLLRHRDCMNLIFSCLLCQSPIRKKLRFDWEYSEKTGTHKHGLATLVGLEPTTFEYLL